MKFERQEQPTEPEKDGKREVSRRDFLKKAGRFVSGAMVAGSVGEELYQRTDSLRRSKERAPERFHIDAVVEEIENLRKTLGDAADTEIQKRIHNGVGKMLEAWKNQKTENATRTMGIAGLTSGGVGGLILSLRDLDERDRHEGKQFSDDELKKEANKIALFGMAMRALTQLGTKAFYNFKTEKNILREAAQLADSLLPRSRQDVERMRGQEKGDPMSQMRQEVSSNTVESDEYFSKELGLKSQIERWAAGTTVAAYASLMEQEKQRS